MSTCSIFPDNWTATVSKIRISLHLLRCSSLFDYQKPWIYHFPNFSKFGLFKSSRFWCFHWLRNFLSHLGLSTKSLSLINIIWLDYNFPRISLSAHTMSTHGKKFSYELSSYPMNEKLMIVAIHHFVAK